MTTPGTPIPTATLKSERKISLLWLIPLLALLFTGWIAARAWQQRGAIITVHFDKGHGLKAGDPVRFRGIEVGRVRDIELHDDLEGITVTLGLTEQANRIARSGTRFWIVRPEFSFGGIAGLETILGPRYVGVYPPPVPPTGNPNDARPRRSFVGLDTPPAVESIQPGDLQIVLQGQRRGSLISGSPILYRQLRIGTILSVALAGDGSAVEARGHIQAAYAPLVRSNSQFWDSGGIDMQADLTGLHLDISSLETILRGGVSLATPEQLAEAVATGHRFLLHHEPEEEWLEWQPSIAVGDAHLPPGAPRPNPLQARLSWRKGLIFRGSQSRQGWVLLTEDGLWGPLDLLQPPDNAREDTITLEVAGVRVDVSGHPVQQRGKMGLLPREVHREFRQNQNTTDARPLRYWSLRRMHHPEAIEDCLVFGDPTAPPQPLAAARLTKTDAGWTIDPALPIHESWHGACVVSQKDGAIIGFLIVEEGEGMVALVGSE